MRTFQIYICRWEQRLACSLVRPLCFSFALRGKKTTLGSLRSFQTKAEFSSLSLLSPSLFSPSLSLSLVPYFSSTVSFVFGSFHRKKSKQRSSSFHFFSSIYLKTVSFFQPNESCRPFSQIASPTTFSTMLAVRREHQRENGQWRKFSLFF